MPGGLRAQTIKGLGWSFFGQIGNQAFRLAITILLARLLSPDEFGIIAMITVFSGVGRLLIDFGFSSAIVQHQGLTQKDYSAVFWLNTFIGVALALLLCTSSEAIASFYAVPILQPITIVVSSTLIFNGLNVIQNALLIKELKFRVLTLRNLSATAVAGIVACILAYLGFGVWSLAIQLALNAGLSTLFIWLVSDWRPSFYYSSKSIKKLAGISGSLFTNSSLAYVVNNLDNLLIGKLFGQGNLGLYSKSFSIISIAPALITKVISKVFLPAFSKIQHDKEKIGEIYLKGTKLISIFSFPLMAYIAIYAYEFVLLIFGSQWLEAVPFIQIFCVSGAVASINALLGSVIISQGRTDLIYREAFLKRPILLIGIVIGAFFSPLGIAIGKLLADIINLGITFWQIRSSLHIPMITQILVFKYVVLSVFATSALLVFLNALFSHIENPIFVVFPIITGGFCYLSMITFLERPLVLEIKMQLLGRNQ